MLRSENVLNFCTYGAGAKDSEGIQSIGPRIRMGPAKESKVYHHWIGNILLDFQK